MAFCTRLGGAEARSGAAQSGHAVPEVLGARPGQPPAPRALSVNTGVTNSKKLQGTAKQLLLGVTFLLKELHLHFALT